MQSYACTQPLHARAATRSRQSPPGSMAATIMPRANERWKEQNSPLHAPCSSSSAASQSTLHMLVFDLDPRRSRSTSSGSANGVIAPARPRDETNKAHARGPLTSTALMGITCAAAPPPRPSLQQPTTLSRAPAVGHRHLSGSDLMACPSHFGKHTQQAQSKTVVMDACTLAHHL